MYMYFLAILAWKGFNKPMFYFSLGTSLSELGA
jgi:hypothetical protein